MKKLVLFTWLLILVLSPYINDFATLLQLELAFVIWSIWYYNKALSAKSFNAVLITYGVFYSWLYITDQVITSMPYYATVLESIFVCLVILCHIDDDYLTK